MNQCHAQCRLEKLYSRIALPDLQWEINILNTPGLKANRIPKYLCLSLSNNPVECFNLSINQYIRL